MGTLGVHQCNRLLKKVTSQTDIKRESEHDELPEMLEELLSENQEKEHRCYKVELFFNC